MELKKLKTIQQIMESEGACFGSKSGYRQLHPKDLIVFNANICSLTEKIWFGDLNLSLSLPQLFALAKALNEDLFVLREHDARFQNENNFDSQKNYVIKLSASGIAELNPNEWNFELTGQTIKEK